MKLSAELVAFQDRLGHTFARPELLVRALTHGSVSSATRTDNQRLEFLGDRVLGLVIADALLDHDKAATEGQLAPRFNALVRKEACAEVAQSIDLGVVLKLGRSEMLSGGRRKLALLGDAMEAVLAAVYRDGGLEAARPFIIRHWEARAKSPASARRDAKTELQEWAHQVAGEAPTYELEGRTGPDHDPLFTVSARLKGYKSVGGKGRSKREAEQNAAAAMLEREGTWDKEENG